MTALKGKHGSWINQFALPSTETYLARARQVDYVVIKYGQAKYEKLSHENGLSWVAERMGESGVGSQNGPAFAKIYATQLANQAKQPGCIAAVINLEEADGGWHTDNGDGTNTLIGVFRALAPGVPLFASLDTRGNRPNYPYQRVCAEKCDGVMPMVYPGAFGLPASTAFASALTPLMYSRWSGKEVIATYQTYKPPNYNVWDEVHVVQDLWNKGKIVGANSYTLGHASLEEWNASLQLHLQHQQVPLPPPPLNEALLQIRKMWEAQWKAIAERGTYEEAVALTQFWKKILGKA